MVTFYVTNRKKAIDRMRPVLSHPKFQAERDFFVASIYLELGISKELINEIIEEFIKADIIYQSGSMLYTTKTGKEEKTIGEKEADEEFKKLGI